MSKIEDLISIVVPIYNVEKYLSECIDSILAQTYKNIEILLINDGSTDSSGMICDEYKKKDDRIIVIHKTNGGLSDARNKGLEIAKGKYISFIDSDDYISNIFIQSLYRVCIENDCQIAVCNYVRQENILNTNLLLDKKNINVFNNIQTLEKIYGKDYLKTIVAWNKLYLREVFKKTKYPYSKIHEDEATTYKVIYNAKNIGFTSLNLYYYRLSEESITNKKYNKKRLDVLYAIKERLIFFENKNMKKLYNLTMSHYCICLLAAYYKSKKNILNSETIQKKVLKEFKSYALKTMTLKYVKFKYKVAILFAYFFPNLYGRIFVK